jgi:hypothetical protein
MFKLVMATTMNHFPALTLQAGNDFAGVSFIAHGQRSKLEGVQSQSRMRIMMRIILKTWNWAVLKTPY